MKSTFFFFMLLFTASPAFPQKVNEAISPDQNYTLQERYRILRDNSPTYNEYKEIKGYLLENWWKIVTDSVDAQKQQIRLANAKIKELENEIKKVQAAMKEKDESMADMIHDSSHIEVLGIDMQKGFFITLVSVTIGALIALIVIGSLRMKWMHSEMKEKIDLANQLGKEFEEYKRNALDKQMKLSRELQNERNKSQEMRSM